MKRTYPQHVLDQVVSSIQAGAMLAPGDRVVAAVSGGLDSSVMLHTLAALRQRLQIHVHCAHLNHQFRGAEAERDAAFVRRLADELGIACTVDARDVPAFAARRKLSPQDAARQLRYQFLTTVADRIGAAAIATAHTADDQAETVLVGLIRGVGLHGLGGIQPVAHNPLGAAHARLIRPFLDIPRQHIERMARDANIGFVEDTSNASRKYLRNAVRLDLLPLLQAHFNPAIVERLGHYARRFREDADCLDRIAADRYDLICEDLPERVKINLDLFAKECITIQRALIYRSFQALTGTRHLLESRHARAVIALYTEGRPGTRLSLPAGVRAHRESAWGYLTTQPEELVQQANAANVCLPAPGTTQAGPFQLTVEACDPPASQAALAYGEPATLWEQYLDAARVSFPIHIRFRRPGDVFHPLGMQGKKRLKKFFIDRKIPKNKRDTIPIFEDAAGIIWIVGLSIDERVKLTPHTTHALRCRVELI